MSGTLGNIMDIVLLILLLLVFLLPSLLMARKQRRNQAEIKNYQDSLHPGERVVTVSGLHGTIVSIRPTEIDLEIAPGVVITLEKMSVVRNENQGMVGTAEYGHPEDAAFDGSPEQEYPLEDQSRREEGPEGQTPGGGHPENLR